VRVTLAAQAGRGHAQHAADVDAEDLDAAIAKSLRRGYSMVTTLCGKSGDASQGREFDPESRGACGSCRARVRARTQPSG
jgi:hypothetical protein